MRNLKVFWLVWTLVLTEGCGAIFVNPLAKVEEPPSPPLKPLEPLQGDYCTVSSLYSYLGPNTGVMPFALQCLQPDGRWERQAEYTALPNFDYQTDTLGGAHYCYQPSLAKAENGDFLVTFVCDNASTWISRFVQGIGWQTPTRIETIVPQSGRWLAGVTQYGGYISEHNGNPVVLWDNNTWGATVSSVVAGVVNHLIVEPQDPEPLPNGRCFSLAPFHDPDNGDFYVYCGDNLRSSPKVYKYSSGTFVSLGTVPAANVRESTIYTSLGKWNGKIVIAYTASEYVGWNETTDVSRVAIYDGKSWQVISEQLEDTPGHAATRPFVFVVGGELHAMYFDYTSVGVSTDSQVVRGRYRVKKWNGTVWERVGGESETVHFTHRNEFLLDGSKVLFGAVRYNENLSQWEKIVLGWSDGQFSSVGAPLKTCSKYSAECDRSRPGAILKLD